MLDPVGAKQHDWIGFIYVNFFLGCNHTPMFFFCFIMCTCVPFFPSNSFEKKAAGVCNHCRFALQQSL